VESAFKVIANVLMDSSEMTVPKTYVKMTAIKMVFVLKETAFVSKDLQENSVRLENAL